MSVAMDDNFKYFYETNGFGPAQSLEPVAETTFQKYRGKLPDQLLEYWREYGFCSFGAGLLWTVDPAPYAPLVDLWLQDTGLLSKDQYFVIGRSAFGKLFLWGTASGQSLKIDSAWGMMFPRDQRAKVAAGKADFLAQRFFGGFERADLDQEDDRGTPLFQRALSTLGQLRAGEMYGFEPALALGGRPDSKNLRKVQAIPHLTILAGLGERKLMRDIVQDAQRAGLIK